MVEIRKCGAGDLPGVMEFIHAHWAKDHVLARHRPLMDWQHADEGAPGTYNWLIAVDGEGIQGILGYIPTSKYDSSLAGRLTWLALWKIRPEPKNRTVGLQLLNTLAKSGGTGVVAVLGINPAHPPMYRALGYRVGELAHHFVCDPGRTQTLIGAPEGYVPPAPSPGRAVFREADAAFLDSLELAAAKVPAKTPRYFINRYLVHPVYRYRVFAVELDGRTRALMAARIASHGDARVLRFVDFLGEEEALAQSGSAIAERLRADGCEYADFWEHGLSPATLSACGFRKAPPGGDVVVPNYFEPFLRKGARIEFAVKGAGEGDLAIFRGDGDQDRPNRIPEAGTAGGSGP